MRTPISKYPINITSEVRDISTSVIFNMGKKDVYSKFAILHCTKFQMPIIIKMPVKNSYENFILAEIIYI
jgi:hypothetical protein